MQDIDLGDRRGLIDLIYGTKEPAKVSSETHSVSNSTMTPLTENERNMKKEKHRLGCSVGTGIFLFILAIIAIILAAWASHYVTKEEYIKQMALVNYTPQPRRNTSQGADEIEYEEEEPAVGPTAEELKLPYDFSPEWYKLSLKTYLPGYVKIPRNKNNTVEGKVLIKLKANQDTKLITLNSKYIIIEDASSVRILKEERSNRVRRDSEAVDNGTMVEESSENETPLVEEVSSTTMEAVTVTVTVGTTESPFVPSENKVLNVKHNDTLDHLTILLTQMVPKGESIIVEIPYTTGIGDSPSGLFSTNYKAADGTLKTIATTQMEPIYARRLVPCMDEPHLKAAWQITVIHPNGTHVKGNSIESEDSVETSDPNWLRTTFDETSPMSTSQLSLIISAFVFNEATTSNGVKVRVWSRPEVSNDTHYALATAVKTLEKIKDFYGVPLNRAVPQDIVAIPDFEADSIENPGLVLFKESSVVYNPQTSSLQDKVSIAQKLAHELHHQWFGSLVSLSSYDSLWVDSAVANLMEFETLKSTLDEKIDVDSLELVDSIERVFMRDAQSSSHPLSLANVSPYDAYDMFDLITYEKGAAVLRMVRSIIGEEAFKKGLQIYLNTFKDGHANYAQLLKSLNEAQTKKIKNWDGSSFDVSEFAKTWILQMGYPVLEVYRIDAHTVEITQKRFKVDNLTPERAKYRNALFWYKWDVPLFMEINGKKQDLQFLHEAHRQTLNISELLLLNTESNGYYRVNYDEAGWKQIVDQLNQDHTKLSAPARGRILSDAFHLAASSMLPYETLFNLTQYLDKETEFEPTVIALRGLHELFTLLEDTNESESVKKLIVAKLQKLYEGVDVASLSTEDESQYLDVRRKLSILSTYCTVNPVGCKNLYKQQIEENLLAACNGAEFTSTCSKVPAALRLIVYCEAISRGDEETFEQFKKFAANEVVNSEKETLVRSLGCSRNPRTIKRLLRSLLEKSSPIGRSSVQDLVGTIRNSPVGNLVATDFILDNWKEINKKLDNNRSVLSYLVNSAVDVDSEREIKQVENFITVHKTSTRPFGAFKAHLETGRSAVNWMKKQKPQITQYFKNMEKKM